MMPALKVGVAPVSVVSTLSVTAPEYPCVPVVVIVVVLIAVVPLTLRVETPVTVLSNTALPVMASEFAPPVMVLEKVTVEPLVIVFPVSIIASVYICVPVVVIAPVIFVCPPLLQVRLLIPEIEESIVVVPLKLRVRL